LGGGRGLATPPHDRRVGWSAGLADAVDADNAIFAYVDGWYNRERIQKDLGWLSPDEYEAAWYAKAIDPNDPTTICPELAPSR
jgi:hypothetical protein